MSGYGCTSARNAAGVNAIYCAGGSYYCDSCDDGGDWEFALTSYSANLIGSNMLLGSWNPGPSIPVSSSSFHCVSTTNAIYCLFPNYGSPDRVMYSQIQPSGALGSWYVSANSYPFDVGDMSCASTNFAIFCVGGTRNGYLNAAAYANILPNNDIGVWRLTTSYPMGLGSDQCVSFSGVMYCIGGYSGGYQQRVAYYAPMQTSGLGSWTSTNAILAQPQQYGGSYKCAVSAANVIYCKMYGSNSLSYYAPILSSGQIGAWIPTLSYPSPFNGITIPYACISNPTTSIPTTSIATTSTSTTSTSTTIWHSLFCVGAQPDNAAESNSVYVAQYLPSNALAAWTSTNSYPTNVMFSSSSGQWVSVNAIPDYCMYGSDGYVYCFNNKATVPYSGYWNYLQTTYYAAVLSSNTLGTWSVANSNPPIPNGGSIVFCTSQYQGITCVGLDGTVYYTKLLGPGTFDVWQQSYKAPGADQCTVVSGNIYCVYATYRTPKYL